MPEALGNARAVRLLDQVCCGTSVMQGEESGRFIYRGDLLVCWSQRWGIAERQALYVGLIEA